MEKPMTLRVNDLIVELCDVINKAELPAPILKNVIEKIYQDICKTDEENIMKYQQEQEKGKSDIIEKDKEE